MKLYQVDALPKTYDKSDTVSKGLSCTLSVDEKGYNLKFAFWTYLKYFETLRLIRNDPSKWLA